MTQKIEISHRTIIFTVLFLLFCWFLFQIREILLIFFIGLILMSALNPLVERLTRLKIPRVIGAVLVYLVVLGVFGLIMAGIIPPLVSQTGILISRLPEYFNSLGLDRLGQGLADGQVSQLLDRLAGLSLDIVKLTIGIFGNLITVFVLVFVSFYLILEHKNFNLYFEKLFGLVNGKKAIEVFQKVEKRLGDWARAQITLMIIIGLLSYVGLYILGIEFALPLALLAGVLEIVPNIGPTISAVPAVLAGLAISPFMGLAVLALYILIQQFENHIIVPQIMAREVGVNPLVTILSLAAGFKIAGVAGAVLAIPLVLLVETIFTEAMKLRKTP